MSQGKVQSYTEHELLDAQAHVWNNVFGFVNSMCLKCALELDIPDTIHKHKKPMTISELIKTLNINESKSLYIDCLMRVLVHAKFFTKVKMSSEDNNEEEFMLTPACLLFFIKDCDYRVASFVPPTLDHDFISPWYGMSRWFQNDHPNPFWAFHGRTFWDHCGLNLEQNRIFNEGMASDTRLVSRIVPRDCKKNFQGLELVVDVGGGTGYMAKVISDEFPCLKCIVLDLPQVVDGSKGDDKVTFIGGNMFEYIPPCDAVFLKLGGKVIIVDMVVGDNDDEDHKIMETQLFFDMTMMVLFCGKESTEKDWAKLFIEAGFTSYKIHPLLGLRSLIEVFP